MLGYVGLFLFALAAGRARVAVAGEPAVRLAH
jgi:hypothetical protein